MRGRSGLSRFGNGGDLALVSAICEVIERALASNLMAGVLACGASVARATGRRVWTGDADAELSGYCPAWLR